MREGLALVEAKGGGGEEDWGMLGADSLSGVNL